MRTSRLAISDRTYVGKNGKNKSFWFFVNNTYSAYIQKTQKHPKGKEYEDFVNELVRRRDVLKKALEVLNSRRIPARPGERRNTKKRSALAKTLIGLRAEARRAKESFVEYRNLSIELNFRFILKQAGHYSLSIPKDRYHDLVQECVMGWIRGLETFDPSRSRLTTHCSYWILQGVRRFVFHDHVVHVPIYQYEKGVRLENALSLHAPVMPEWMENSAHHSMLDFMVDKDALDPDDQAHKMELSRYAHSLLSGLDSRERDILRLRFGMSGSDPDGATLDAVGEMYGLTRERIRQIEKNALNKIRDGIQRGRIKLTARPVLTVIQGGGE